VVREEDTEHVPNLALVPVGTLEDLNGRRNGGDLVGIRLDADTRLVRYREEVVDDLGLVLTRKEGEVLEGRSRKRGRDVTAPQAARAVTPHANSSHRCRCRSCHCHCSVRLLPFPSP
jgi:hypothetical protein